MNFSQAIAALGINEKQAVINLKRRESYRQSLDRPKVWPGTRANTPIWVFKKTLERHSNRDEPDRQFSILRTTTNTAEYVSAWCYLNHLKGV